MRITPNYQVSQPYNASSHVSNTRIKAEYKTSDINFSSKYYSREALDLITEKACQWWTKTLFNPNFYVETGDRISGLLTDGLFSAMHKPPTEEQTKVFQQTFKKELEKRINELGKYNHLSKICIICGVDNYPCGVLSTALKRAKLPASELPVKTTMYLDNGKLTVRDGYQAPFEDIYELPTELKTLTDIKPKSNRRSLFDWVLGRNKNSK